MDVIFTPENEPYLGRQAVHQFDRLIVVSLQRNEELAGKSRDADLSDLQLAACQIVPQALKLALAQRELVRQGYLFAARVLTRSLVERAVILLYLESNPDEMRIWKSGWRYPERPALRTMLKRVSDQHMPFLNDYPDLVDEFNSLTHGDPASVLHNLTFTEDGGPVFGVSKDLNSPEICDRACQEVSLWLGHLMLAAGRVMGVRWQ
jgi:hypothetical protein